MHRGQIQTFWIGGSNLIKEGSILSIYLNCLKIPHVNEIIWTQRVCVGGGGGGGSGGTRATPLDHYWIRRLGMELTLCRCIVSTFCKFYFMFIYICLYMLSLAMYFYIYIYFFCNRR